MEENLVSSMNCPSEWSLKNSCQAINEKGLSIFTLAVLLQCNTPIFAARKLLRAGECNPTAQQTHKRPWICGFHAGLRALVYSGDRDGILGVPWPGSQTWTYIVGQDLGLKQNGNWTDWYIPDPDNFGDQVKTLYLLLHCQTHLLSWPDKSPVLASKWNGKLLILLKTEASWRYYHWPTASDFGGKFQTPNPLRVGAGCL